MYGRTSETVIMLVPSCSNMPGPWKTATQKQQKTLKAKGENVKTAELSTMLSVWGKMVPERGASQSQEPPANSTSSKRSSPGMLLNISTLAENSSKTASHKKNASGTMLRGRPFF